MGESVNEPSESVRGFLARKYEECETREGRSIVAEAISLRPRYPRLSGPELIRLAYWGASGTPQHLSDTGEGR